MHIEESEFCNSIYGELQNEGSCGWYVKKSHSVLEKRIPILPDSCNVLELGCNLGEHTIHVKHPYKSYTATDYRSIDFVPLNDRIHFEIADAQKLVYSDNLFDRVLVFYII